MSLVGPTFPGQRNTIRTAPATQTTPAAPKVSASLNDPGQRVRADRGGFVVSGQGVNNGFAPSAFTVTVDGTAFSVGVGRGQSPTQTAERMKAKLDAAGHQASVTVSGSDARLTVTPGKAPPAAPTTPTPARSGSGDVYGSGNPFRRGGFGYGSCLGGGFAGR